MRFWPSDSFEIETTLSLRETIALLDAHVEPKRLFRFFSDHKTFEGQLAQDGFKITRIISHGNAFLPVITGKFAAGQSGTTISIKMRIPVFAAAFMCFWFAGVGIGVFDTLVGLAMDQTPSVARCLIAFAMPILGYVLVVACFWPEAKRARRVLEEMFQDKSPPPRH
jgi:hypothetical protein